MARYDANQSVDSSARVRIIGKEIKDGGGYTVSIKLSPIYRNCENFNEI